MRVNYISNAFEINNIDDELEPDAGALCGVIVVESTYDRGQLQTESIYRYKVALDPQTIITLEVRSRDAQNEPKHMRLTDRYLTDGVINTIGYFAPILVDDQNFATMLGPYGTKHWHKIFGEDIIDLLNGLFFFQPTDAQKVEFRMVIIRILKLKLKLKIFRTKTQSLNL